jgi:hypothetical protein
MTLDPRADSTIDRRTVNEELALSAAGCSGERTIEVIRAIYIHIMRKPADGRLRSRMFAQGIQR